MSCEQRLREEMRLRGVRVTPQRAVILETLSHLGGHPTASDVYGEASRHLPGLNPATVYRALEALQAAGLVDTMDTGSGRVRFALHDVSHPHHHLVCSTCGREFELEPRVISDLAKQVERSNGFRMHTGHMVLTGHCKACAREAAEED
jgi:Fur family ferric uptake transcriptional regulator